jgi:phosphate transport system protein
MERHFEKELQKLKDRIQQMATLVDQQMQTTMQALINTDSKLADEVIDLDNKVDQLDVKIDKLCQRIFALTQPIATDLRFIMSALKINNDLERIGDLGVFIAKRVTTFVDYHEILIELGIDEVANDTIRLMRTMENLIHTNQVVLVKDIFESSQALKLRTREVSAKIVEEMTNKTYDVVIVATNLVLILSQIERITALCNNIAESVYFIVEGEIVKHSKDFLAE